MAPSRRRVLRLAALSATGIAGCTREPGTPTVGDTVTPKRTPGDTTTESPTEPPTESPTETPADDPETRAGADCDRGLTPTGWPLQERSPGATNHHPGATGPTRPPGTRWMATATPPEKGKVQYTRPVVDTGTVYVGRQILVGTNQRLPDVQHVQAFDAACGDHLWRAPVAGNPGGLMVTDETVFVHDDATLYALDAATGQRRWAHEPSDAIAHAVATDDGVLLTSVSDGSSEELRAVRPDGSVGWRLSVPATVVGDLAWVDGRAYLVTDDAVLLAVDTGSRSVAWSLDLQDGEDTVPGRVAATPEVVVAVVDGVVYAVTSGGAREWSTDVGVRDLATDGDAVYGVDLDGYARALSVDDGAEQWRRFHGRENPRLVDGFYGTPALGEGTLYAGTLDGTLLAMAAGDGAERWRLHHDWEGDAAVALAEETLVVAWGNHLLALR